MIKSTIFYGAASLLPALLGFFLLPFYSRTLSTSEFGIIAAMGVLSAVISAFSDLSLTRAAFRFYFDFTDEKERKKVLGTFFIGSNVIAIFCFVILMLFKPLLVMAYPQIDFYPYYFLTIITVVVSVSGNYVLSYFRISEKPYFYFLCMLLTMILQGGLVYYFVFLKKQNALGQIYALLYLSLILLPLYLAVAYKKFAVTFDWPIFKEGLSYSWPAIPSLLIAWVLNWSNSLFLAHYGTMSEVGMYAMAYKISTIFLLVTGAFSIAYQPVFFRKANEENQILAKQSLFLIIQTASKGFIAGGFLLALFSEDIVRLLLDEKYRDIYFIIRIILLSHILPAIMGISSNLYFLQSKRTKLQLAVVSSSALINILLNYLLVPKYGMYGAAFATVISMTVMTSMSYAYSRTCYFINIYWWKLSAMIAVSALTVMFFQQFVEGFWFSLLFKIIFLVMLTALFFINKRVRNLFREFSSQ